MEWGIRGVVRGALALAALVASWGLAAAQPAGAPATPASTASDSAGKTALRARQSALFEQLRRAPGDLDLMFAYAEVSARLEDYEAAISTLERMLIFDPNLARVRLELGALYFKIGSYEVSRRYFNTVLARPDLPPEVQGRVNAYLAEIDRRTQRHRFSGSIGAGVVFSTNANLGPADNEVLFAGLPATLERSFVAVEDFGARGFVRLRHEWDFAEASDDHWRTDLSAFGLRYDTTTAGEVAAVTVRTGPRLSLDERQYGPKIRPFIEGSYLDVGRDPLYFAGGGGFELQQIIADQWFAFGEARAQYRDYFEPRNRNDGWTARAVAGVAFAPSRDLSFRLIGTTEREFARVDFEQSWEGELRVTGSFDYDPGINFIDRKWNLSGFAKIGYRRFDAPDIAVDPDEKRQDFDYGIGLAHTFHIVHGWALTVDADYLFRDSNLKNFDLDSANFGLSVSYNF